MAPFLELLAQGVETENDTAAVVWLVEVAALLLGGEFTQRVLYELLVGAGVKVAVDAVQVRHAGRNESAFHSPALVLEFGFVPFEETPLDSRLGHRLAADGVTGHVVPQIDSV